MIAIVVLRVIGLLTTLGVGYLVFDYTAADKNVGHALSGQVRLAGRPLPSGTVRFISADVNRFSGAGSFVLDGKYTISSEGGLPPGKYQVQISGIGRKEQIQANREFLNGLRPDANLDEPLPAHYNFKSRIEVEVAPDGGVVGFDFDLK